MTNTCRHIKSSEPEVNRLDQLLAFSEERTQWEDSTAEPDDENRNKQQAVQRQMLEVSYQTNIEQKLSKAYRSLVQTPRQGFAGSVYFGAVGSRSGSSTATADWK